MTAPVLLIVADDLTGAADCGAACVRRGLDTTVLLAPDAATHGAEVVAIDADTRALSAKAAVERTVGVLAPYRGRDCIVFKKIDSTLRGHFAAELAAALSVRRARVPESVAILAPAFPAMGRTTVEGRHLLWGKPLEETELWRGEGRAGRAFIPAMVANAGLRVELLRLDHMRAGVDLLAAAIRRLAVKADVVVCDAESDDDLAALAKASFQLGRQAIWAGSAGLVGHLADAAGLTRTHAGHAPASVVGSQVFVIGSRSEVSRRQAAALAALEGVEVVDIDPAASSEELDEADFGGRFSAALETGKVVLVWQAGEKPPADAAKSRRCGDLAARIAGYADRIGALFATGGETARCLLEALGVRALRLVDEIEPGVALSVAAGRRGLAVITKAGAFGHDATLAACRAAFSRAATAIGDGAVNHRRVGA